MKTISTMLILAWLLIHTLPHTLAAETKLLRQLKAITDKACTEMSSEDSTKLGLIRQVLAEGKPHAALAHLDAARIKHEQAELLRANALRQTGRVLQAQAIYEQLANSCVSGQAYRGLGLIASNAGRLQDSLSYLEAASRALPTEHTIRNDYGYVLMQSGNYEVAIHEFLTALELAPDYRQAANNLVLLLYQQGDTAKAEAFAKQFGMVAEEMQQLKKMTQASNSTQP